jgi:hypothetical protein
MQLIRGGKPFLPFVTRSRRFKKISKRDIKGRKKLLI